MDTEALRRMAQIPTKLSGWKEGEPFECVLRRPSMYRMIASGNIPNPLIPVIERLFTATVPKELTAEEMQKESEALMHIARETLVEPTLTELEEAGIDLTNDQIMEIYAFAVMGPEGLASFRLGARGRAGGDGQGNAPKAKRAAVHK